MSYEKHYINGVDYTDLRTFRPTLSFDTVLQGLTVGGKWVEIGSITFPDTKENTMHPDAIKEPAMTSEAKPTWQDAVNVMINEYQKKYDEQIHIENLPFTDNLGEDANALAAKQAEEYAISIKTLRELIQRMEK